MADTDDLEDTYACYMTDEDEADEQRGRLEELFDRARSVDKTDDGLRVEVPREEGLAQTAADFAVLESWCCPWARYEVGFEPGRETVVLQVTADEAEAVELLHQYPTGEVPDRLDVPIQDELD